MRALLIEDSPADADLLREVLLAYDCFDVEIEWVERLERALLVLDERTFDIILLDLSLPDSDSLAGLKRARAKAPDVPIIILTGLDDHDLGVEAVKYGAQDYLVKGRPNGESIYRAMRYAIERHRIEQISFQNAQAAKEAAAMAEEAQVNLELALLSSEMLVWSFDLQEEVLRWLGPETAIASIDAEPSLEEFTNLIHPDDRDTVIGALRACGDGKEDYNVEYRIVDGSGGVRWFVSRGKTLLDAEQKPCRVTGVCRETTRERRQEENSRRLALLEQRNEFVAMLAHDLKTPIIGCQRILGLLVDGTLGEVSDEHAELLRQIRDSNQSMLLMINNVMDTYRHEEGAEIFEFENLDLERLIKACVAELRPLAEGNGIELVVTSELMPHVYADQLAMRRVIGNLLGNAIKFTPPGGKVTLSVLQRDGRALVQVEDSGVGIEPDALEHIFERFYQERSKYRGSGLGLGLYLCRRLMAAQSGTIICRSEPGKGTTFELTVPLALVGSPAQARSTRSSVGAELHIAGDCMALPDDVGSSAQRLVLLKRERRQPEGVLVVDSERANRLVLKRVLKSLSINADFVSTAEEALQAVAQQNYAAVFVDIVMPGFVGLETTRALRRAGVETPILAYGEISVPESSEVKEAGFDDFLCEPLTSACVKNLVLKWIKEDAPPIAKGTVVVE